MAKRAVNCDWRVLLGALFIFAEVGAAQEVRGVVLHADSRVPVQFALVLVLDADGRTVAQALTDSSGEFDFDVVGAGVALRAERIGLGVVTHELSDPPAIGRIELLLRDTPVQIEGISVAAVDQCPAHPRDEYLAQAWSQFRPLLASLESIDRDPPRRFEVEYSESELDSRGEVVATLVVDTLELTNPIPFVTEEPSVLAERGFVVEDSDSTIIYYAPDARVLLSPEFIGSHCYRLPETQDRNGYLEIEFVPRGENVERDIRGVFALPLIDERLPIIEFYFTSHPWRYESDERLGGFVELAPTEFGWVVSRWQLRVPGPPMVAVNQVPPISSMTAYGGRLLHVAVGRD